MPSAFVPRIRLLLEHIGTISWPALAVSIASLAIILFLPRVVKRIPGLIVAMLVCTIFVVLSGVPIDTIGSKFGGIPAGLPKLSFPNSGSTRCCPCFLPHSRGRSLPQLESLLSAVVADGMSGT